MLKDNGRFRFPVPDALLSFQVIRATLKKGLCMPYADLDNDAAVIRNPRALPAALFLACLGICLSGCAGSSHFSDPAYGKEEFRADAVGFIPIRYSEIRMDAYDEFHKAFKNEPVDSGEIKLAKAFNEAFLNSARGRFKDFRVLDSGAVSDPYSQSETKQILDKGKKSQRAMRIDIPRKGVIDSMNPPIRFLIVAREAAFTFERKKGSGFTMAPGATQALPGGSTMHMGGGMIGASSSSKNIILIMKYMVWDYRKDAPVSYGIIETKMSAGFFFTQSEWLSMMERASGAILSHTPLKIGPDSPRPYP